MRREMSRPIDSPTGLTEFGPLTPDEKPQGYGFSISKLFRRAVRGGSSKSGGTSDNQDQLDANNRIIDSTSRSSSINEGGPSWLVDKGVHDSGSECSDTYSVTSSSSLVNKTAVSSGHDRTLPNVLTRIRNIIDNRGSTPQQYKDSDFKQYWLPDSTSVQCYECEERFTTFRRRHHCRVCGQIFCSRCCNSMIPGKIIGYTGELRVCTYCCKVVLSYLQSSNLAADVLADLRALQEELLPPESSQSSIQNQDNTYYVPSGSNTPLTTPRGTLRRRPSLGFQEEKYASRTRYTSGDYSAFGGQRHDDQMTAERQLLLRDSQQLHSLWSQMAGGAGGLPLASHRHRLKAFHNCFIGRDLVQWLLSNDKASSRASSVAIGQALLEAGYIVCISQPEQVFVDDYVLYRPMRPSSGSSDRYTQENLSRGQEGGQEPLWVKQISSMAEGIEEVDASLETMKKEASHQKVDTPTSISSSTSNYCLDLNIQDNVVSMKKPHNMTRQSSCDSDHSEAKNPVAGGFSNVHQSYATTVSAALSASALPSSSFATDSMGGASSSTGAVLMDEDVLEAIRGHEACNSLPRTSGWQYEESSHVDNQELLVRQRLNTMWSSHESALLCQLLDSSGLSPSWAETILPIVATVTDIIRPDVKNDSDDMDIRQYIQFKKVPGGSRNECQILNGAVCSKNVADKSMMSRLTDPQILLVASTIDYQRGNDNKLLTFDNLLLQEADYLKNVVAKIVSYKPNIILVEKSIAYLAREYLQAKGITLVMNVKPSVMERVARCTQAELVSSIDAQLKKPVLGMCHNFYVRSYSLPGKNKNKTLMFFDGCATHLGCTIILRGATNAELKRVKKIMLFMIYAVYNWKLERSFLMDEYAMIPPLPSESFELEDQVFEEAQSVEDQTDRSSKQDSVMDNCLKVVDNTNVEVEVDSVSSIPCEESTQAKLRKLDSQKDVRFAPREKSKDAGVCSSESGSSTPGGTSDKTKVSQTINDFSDPLHSYLNSGTSPQEVPQEPSLASLALTELPLLSKFRKTLDDTILSCSPYIKYTVPYLESEASRDCTLRKYFEKDLYFSPLLEQENFVRRPRFSEMDAKETKDVNQNVRIKSPHKFMNCKITQEAGSAKIQSMLADFRARGGQMALVCKCQDNGLRNLQDHQDYQSQVIVEGLITESGSSVHTTNSNHTPTSGTVLNSGNGSRDKETEATNLLHMGKRITDFPGGVQTSLHLTPDGKIDSLHPFNHQRLSVLFSSFPNVGDLPPEFCVLPWVLSMDFYGRNDIPLGSFLERYCFSSSYMCPSGECTKGLVDHIRKFVHDTGCVDVLLRSFDNNLDDTNTGAILMWSWCKSCRQVTPVTPMSLETWSLSFAKYLELRFFGSSFSRRGDPGCCHSLHHDHFQYFGYKNQVAIFKYMSVTAREIALPPSKIRLCKPPITQSTIVELTKGIAIQGYSVFSTILERITTLKAESGPRWYPLIEELWENQNTERALFRESIESIQLQLTSPTLEARRLHPPTPNTIQELTSTMLTITDQIVKSKILVAKVANEWNSKVQDLVQLRKKEERLEKEKAKAIAATITGGSGLPRQSTSGSISTSSVASALASTSAGEMYSAASHKQGGDTSSVASSAALTGVSMDSLSMSASSLSDIPGQENYKTTGNEVQDNERGSSATLDTSNKAQGSETQEKQEDTKESTDHQKPAEDTKENVQRCVETKSVIPTRESLAEERESIVRALSALLTNTRSSHVSGTSALSISSASSEILNSLGNDSDVNGGLHAVMPNQNSDNSNVLHRRQASDSCDGLGVVGIHTPRSESPGRGHERSLSDGGGQAGMSRETERANERRLATNTVKNIISTFWSSSANLSVDLPFGANEHYLLLPEVKIPVVVYGDEPSTIIAHALASHDYDRQLSALKKKLRDLRRDNSNSKSVDKDSCALSESGAESSGTEDSDFCISASTTEAEKNKGSKDSHLELQWFDQHAKFYCKIFFAEHFRQLRKMVFPYGEEAYIRSLSRCVQWEARGGKSGSVFCKSLDDRFILKEMSRFEMSSFLDFGPDYIHYIVNCEHEQQPTALTRIVGVYRIGYRNNTTNKAMRMDLLVMENLFYQRNITHKFDLKGSIRNRLVNTSGKTESELVLLDENLLRMTCSSPLYVRAHSKTILSKAIAADTIFLSKQLIMDYSLLVGIDSDTNQLIIGIIDYIRTFTWDKKLETIFKGSVIGGAVSKGLPTVVSPELYRTRFCQAMDRYFFMTPDRWTGLGNGVDPPGI